MKECDFADDEFAMHDDPGIHTGSRAARINALSHIFTAGLMKGLARGRSIAAAIFLTGFLLTVSEAGGPEKQEYFKYDVSLSGVDVGSMTLAMKTKGSNLEVISTLTSAKKLSGFYEVADTVATVLRTIPTDNFSQRAEFVPLSFSEKLSEGPYRVDKDFHFDVAKKTVLYKDNVRGEQSLFRIAQPTFDPLSSLYYLRHLSLQVGTSVFLDIFNNKSIYRVEVQVLRREVLRAGDARVNTIVLRTNMNGVGDGIFYYPGAIYFWLTDDEKRIPVMIEKKLDSLVEGNIPDFLKGRVPEFIRDKLSRGSVKATLVDVGEKPLM